MEKIIKNKYFPFLILFITMFIVCLTLKINWGDDVWFKEKAGEDLLNYISSRYNTWTSRILIESVMLILLQLPKFIWCLLTSFMITLLSYCISYMFTKNQYKMNWLIILIVCIYPLNEMNSAGWYATSLNYLYPLALGLFAMLPIKNAILNKKEKIYMYPLYILSLIYACNQEQMAAIIFCFYLIFGIYLFINKKLNKFILIQFVLSILSMIFILTCPGNAERSLLEINTWYPEYMNFGTISKIYLGVVSTILTSIFNLKMSLLVLSILIPIVIFKKCKNSIMKIISFVPLMLICINNIFYDFVSKIYPGINNIINDMKIFTIGVKNIEFNLVSLMSLLVSILFISTLLISVYFIFKKQEKKYVALLVILAGLFSRFIIGFSSTIYASGMRTFLFLDISVIILIIMILDEFKIFKFKNINYLYGFCLLLALLQIFNTCILNIYM